MVTDHYGLGVLRTRYLYLLNLKAIIIDFFYLNYVEQNVYNYVFKTVQRYIKTYTYILNFINKNHDYFMFYKKKLMSIFWKNVSVWF